MREPLFRPSNFVSAFRAAADEGVFGLCHLLVHWHLARTLEPSSYGAFALAMIWGLLGASIHQAFLVEPLLVASTTPLWREPGHLRALLGLHWRIMFPAALLVALLARVLGRTSSVRQDLAAAGAFALGVSLIRLVRGMGYSALPARVGTQAVSAYAGLTALGLGGLAYFRATSGVGALLVMGCSGALAGSLVLWRARLAESSPELRRRVLEHHWEHGRWLVLLSPLRWALDSVPLVILGAYGNLAEVARLRVALIVVAPAVQVIGAVRMMLLARFAEAARQQTLGPLLWRTELAVLLAGGGFFLAVSWAARPILTLFSSSYADAAGVLPIVALTPLLLGSALLFGNVLRAVGRSDLSARAFALASAVATLAALGLVAPYGALGAAIALSLGYGSLLASKGWLALTGSRARIEE